MGVQYDNAHLIVIKIDIFFLPAYYSGVDIINVIFFQYRGQKGNNNKELFYRTGLILDK